MDREKLTRLAENPRIHREFFFFKDEADATISVNACKWGVNGGGWNLFMGQHQLFTCLVENLKLT